MPREKLFTPEEANQLLPRIIPLIEQLQGLQQSISQTTHELNQNVHKLSQGNGYPLQEIQKHVEELTRHQLHLLEAFSSALQQLEDLGAVIKDLSQGLVDFYAMHGSDLVYLCWKLGEDRVKFWHSMEAGFAGRRPLEERPS